MNMYFKYVASPMSPNMTEVVLIRNDKKKTNKISQISYFFRLTF